MQSRQDGSRLDAVQGIDNFKSRVREILTPLDIGVRTGRFTPRLLNLTTITNIIRQHPRLRSTLYLDHPTLIYATSRATIAEVNESENMDAISIHIILTIPLLRQNEIVQYFNIAQTGFKYDNKCWIQKLPKKVYQIITTENNKEEKSFYSLDEVECDGESDLLRTCNLNVTKPFTRPLKIMEVSCLSKEPKNCNMILVKCEEKVVYNTHGLLTRSDHKIKGVLKRVTGNKKINK